MPFPVILLDMLLAIIAKDRLRLKEGNRAGIIVYSVKIRECQIENNPSIIDR